MSELLINSIRTIHGDARINYEALVNKPISDKTLSKAAEFADAKIVGDELDKCVKKEEGKGLSTNDFSNQYKKILDDLAYVKIAFTSSSLDKSVNEIGSTVTTININWKLNKTPNTLKIQFGNEPQETLVNSTTSKSYTNKSIKTNTSITITATDERESVTTKQLTIAFLPKAYWGTADNKESYNISDILGLSDSILTGSRQRTIDVNATAGKHIIYAIPSTFGTPVFNVGGFNGGFMKVGTISLTNDSGHTQNYDIWKSINAGLGQTNITIK